MDFPGSNERQRSSNKRVSNRTPVIAAAMVLPCAEVAGLSESNPHRRVTMTTTTILPCELSSLSFSLYGVQAQCELRLGKEKRIDP
jgi:hypothetical protein